MPRLLCFPQSYEKCRKRPAAREANFGLPREEAALLDARRGSYHHPRRASRPVAPLDARQRRRLCDPANADHTGVAAYHVDAFKRLEDLARCFERMGADAAPRELPVSRVDQIMAPRIQEALASARELFDAGALKTEEYVRAVDLAKQATPPE